MAQLNLVVAEAIRPALGASGIPASRLERLAERAGLPPRIVYEPAGFVPLHATEHFLDLLQRQAGDSGFLFASLDFDPDEKRQTHSVVGVPLPCGRTGVEALEQMTATFNQFITGARFSCRREGGLLWVMRTTGATEWSDVWPVLQYNLSIVAHGTARILGRGLRPRALRLPVQPAAQDLPEDLRDLPIVPDRHRFGLAYHLADIAAHAFVLAEAARAQAGPATDPILGLTRGAIGACISRFLTSTATDSLSERVAQSFGMSARSYRRHLAELGTTHASLLADVRLDLALKLLDDQNHPVTAVAYELGYAHPGDFTRFFKARMGVCPFEYRQRETAAAG